MQIRGLKLDLQHPSKIMVGASLQFITQGVQRESPEEDGYTSWHCQILGNPERDLISVYKTVIKKNTK